MRAMRGDVTRVTCQTQSRYNPAHAMTATRTIAVVAAALACATAVRAVGARPVPMQPQSNNYELMAGHIVRALKVAPGERVMLRVDPKSMPELEPVVRAALERAGAKVETLPYGPSQTSGNGWPRPSVYVAAGASALTDEEQRNALARWVDQGGARREIHFHWSDGTRNLDAMPAPHTRRTRSAVLRRAEDRLRRDACADEPGHRPVSSGEVRVTTPAGTDMRFRTGNGPSTGRMARVALARLAGADAHRPAHRAARGNLARGAD